MSLAKGLRINVPMKAFFSSLNSANNEKSFNLLAVRKGYQELLKQIHPDFFHGQAPDIIKQNEAFLACLAEFMKLKSTEHGAERTLLLKLSKLSFFRKSNPGIPCMVTERTCRTAFLRQLFNLCEISFLTESKDTCNEIRGSKAFPSRAEISTSRGSARQQSFRRMLAKSVTPVMKSRSSIAFDLHETSDIIEQTILELFFSDIRGWIILTSNGVGGNPPLRLLSSWDRKFVAALWTHRANLLAWRKQNPFSQWVFVDTDRWEHQQGSSCYHDATCNLWFFQKIFPVKLPI